MDYRKPIICFILCLLFVSIFSSSAIASSAYLGADKNIAHPQDSNDIILEKEVLQIWLHKGFAEVEDVYQFYNTSGEQEFLMGFPEPINSRSATQYGVYNFRAFIDGNEVDTRTLKTTQERIGKIEGNLNWKTNSVFIGENQRRIVVHKYWIRLVPWENKVFIPLTPASTWKGKIKEAYYVLHLMGSLTQRNIVYPVEYEDYAGKYAILPTGFKAGTDEFVWSYRNYEPAQDMQLQIFPKKGSMIARVNASGVHIENGKTYNAGLALDEDPATAWAVGGPGKGEWMTFVLDQKRWVREFRIIPGYGSLEGMYKMYNRPKEITLVFSDGSKQRYLLKDKLEMQYIQLKPVQTKFIKLNINSVYKGIYPDVTYISEVEFGELASPSKVPVDKWEVGLDQIEKLNLKPAYSITDIITTVATILVFAFIGWQLVIAIRLRNQKGQN